MNILFLRFYDSESFTCWVFLPPFNGSLISFVERNKKFCTHLWQKLGLLLAKLQIFYFYEWKWFVEASSIQFIYIFDRVVNCSLRILSTFVIIHKDIFDFIFHLV